MKRTLWALGVAGALLGCQAGKQREQILANTEQMKEDLRKSREEHAQLLSHDEESAQRETELLRMAKASMSNEQEILTLARETSTTTKASAETLDKTFREVYGQGIDLRSAIGETRVVVSVNDTRPLRVHSQLPGTEASSVVTKLPVGAVLFQSRKVSDRWWRGVMIQGDQKTEVYFAVEYTRPLREELLAEFKPAAPVAPEVAEAPKD